VVDSGRAAPVSLGKRMVLPGSNGIGGNGRTVPLRHRSGRAPADSVLRAPAGWRVCRILLAVSG